MKWLRRSATSIAPAVLMVCLLNPASSAIATESWSRTDQVGDAAPKADIKRAAATWTADVHRATVRVMNLRSHGRLRVAIGHEGEIYHAFVVKSSQGIKKRIVAIDYEGVSGSWPCPGMRVRWNAVRDSVRVRTPIDTCIGGGTSNLTIGASLKVGGAKDTVGSVPFVAD